MIPANKIEELTGATAVYDSTMQSNIDLWRRMYMDDAEWLGMLRLAACRRLSAEQ